MAEVGRPTDLTPELIKEIKQCILDGKNLKETATEIFNNYPNISQEEKDRGVSNYIQKIYNWNCDNYLNLNDKIEGWKRDRKLKLAENNLEAILCLGISDKESLKVVSDITKFTLETLNKKDYSKRSELTGSDGKDLPTPIIKLETNAFQRNNSNEENTEPKQED